MTQEVQAEYAVLYGGDGDTAPIAADEFVAPNGHFVVAEVDGEAAAMGGWRRGGPEPGDAEIKRMFVRARFRRQGLSRLVLAEVERTAAEAGVRRLVLETGLRQPEAIALYRASGYTDIPPFGYYAESPSSVPLGKSLA